MSGRPGMLQGSRRVLVAAGPVRGFVDRAMSERDWNTSRLVAEYAARFGVCSRTADRHVSDLEAGERAVYDVDGAPWPVLEVGTADNFLTLFGGNLDVLFGGLEWAGEESEVDGD